MATQPRTRNETHHADSQFVVINGPDSWRVYATSRPRDVFDVTGTVEHPACTCEDFESHRSRKGYRCEHIIAAFRNQPDPAGARPEARSRSSSGSAGLETDLQMLVKRSISPDRRIDSYSVEFTATATGLNDADVEELALSLLMRQDAIVSAFIDSRQQRATGNGADRNDPRHAPLRGVLRDVGGMQTRYGWRYFINVDVEGKTYKLFGTRKQLSDALTDAGYGQFGNSVVKGQIFDAPCRVILAPSDDEKYLNVESLLPPNGRNGNGR